MKILEKSKMFIGHNLNKTLLFFGVLLSSQLGYATTPEGSAIVPESQSPPIYEQLGVTSTTLFIVMTLFTLLLLILMSSMASSTKNILKYKQDRAKKNNGTKVLLALVGLFASSTTFAAEVSAGNESLVPFPDRVFWAYIVVDLVLVMFIVHFAGIVKGSISDIIVLRKLFRWGKFGKNLTDAVPVDQEESILLDHEYDGITELDNNLPPWWKYGFYITIVWAVVYIFYYQILEIGDLQEAEYLAEMEAGEKEIAEYKAAHPEMINAENVEQLTDAGSISKGKEIFSTYCVSCHMEGGRGGVGPNLTDEYWLYGNDIEGVFTTISEGAENGMTAWKALLPADKIQQVASYVMQLEYVAPPDGKEPQGDKK